MIPEARKGRTHPRQSTWPEELEWGHLKASLPSSHKKQVSVLWPHTFQRP